MKKIYFKGFTLIELLIVVAIIAILAAIAVPNFLEAQVRSKVSRVKADMRTYATAIESYTVDANRNPREYNSGVHGDPVITPGTSTSGIPFPGRQNGNHFQNGLSTPIAYITTAWIADPFVNRDGSINFDEQMFTYQDISRRSLAVSPFWKAAIEYYGTWRMCSIGPDRDFFNNPANPGTSPFTNAGQLAYDATNGTISAGNIWRSQKLSDNTEPPVGLLIGPH